MNTCKDCFHKNVCCKIEHYGRGLESSEPCEHFCEITKTILPAHSCTNCKNIVGRFDCSCPYCKKKLERNGEDGN